MAEIEFFKCETDGSIVTRIGKQGGALTCCGKEMTKLKANSVDAAKEKHVPVVTKEDGKIKVVVGSTPHPMLPEHHIEWIALVSGSKVQFEFLKPGDEPKAEFPEVDSGTVYEHCNIHGLWKAEF